MARKVILSKYIRWYEGEEEQVQAIKSLRDSVVVSDYLKRLIHEALSEKDTDQSRETVSSSLDTETLVKELLPQIRKVFDASIESALARHAISSSGNKKQDKELDEDTQQLIQEGLKKMGLKMMGEL